MAEYNILIGNEVASQTLPRTQVYKATHNDALRKSYMQRSFISFTYGDKFIEDFGLIAYTDGDRMQRDAYASFDDLTSAYDVIPGQFYWGTYYRTNSLALSLETDGMTQEELDNFRYWFRAGSIRELVLAEHPNRAIMARVSTPPQLNLLPFEEPINVPFSISDTSMETVKTIQLPTSTTLYRGEINLEFVMDEPFWYAKQNILGIQDTIEGYYTEKWIDANGVETSIRESKDALKIVYEDHIPLGSTVKLDVFLGGDIYASMEYKVWSQIASTSNEESYNAAQADTNSPSTPVSYFKLATPYIVSDVEPGAEESPSEGEETPYIVVTQEALDNHEYWPISGTLKPGDKVTLSYWKGATIAQNIGDNDTPQWIGGSVGGAELSGTSGPVKGIGLPPGETAYLYYAGTAPSPVKLRFTLKPTFADNFYIILPASKKYNKELPYNTLTLESCMKHEFKFTLPTFWLSYNQALEIFDNTSIMKQGNAWLTVRETIRDTIRHPIIRAWANRLINKYDQIGSSGIIMANEIEMTSIVGDLKEGMQMLFKDNNGENLPASFTFDGHTGEAIGEFYYRDIEGKLLSFTNTPVEAGIDAATLRKQIFEQSANDENYLTTSIENVGDMVRSSYLILDERNVLDGRLQVQSWSKAHPDYAYKITHDLTAGVNEGLQDLHFEFKNMYL